jgi:hypothetical protein
MPVNRKYKPMSLNWSVFSNVGLGLENSVIKVTQWTQSPQSLPESGLEVLGEGFSGHSSIIYLIIA